MIMDFTQIKFDEKGLVPVIAQAAGGNDILMVAWANRQALETTEKTGFATWWSRSRNALWTKGETSGNRMRVLRILLDCDGDTMIYLVEPSGPACHTGRETCFFRKWGVGGWRDIDEE
jgi:phosphoribosyl-AMP cyclohydrolase